MLLKLTANGWMLCRLGRQILTAVTRFSAFSVGFGADYSSTIQKFDRVAPARRKKAPSISQGYEEKPDERLEVTFSITFQCVEGLLTGAECFAHESTGDQALLRSLSGESQISADEIIEMDADGIYRRSSAFILRLKKLWILTVMPIVVLSLIDQSMPDPEFTECDRPQRNFSFFEHLSAAESSPHFPITKPSTASLLSFPAES